MKRYQKWLLRFMKFSSLFAAVILLVILLYLPFEIGRMNTSLNSIDERTLQEAEAIFSRDLDELPKNCFDSIVHKTQFENLECNEELCVNSWKDDSLCYLEIEQYLDDYDSFIFVYGGSSVSSFPTKLDSLFSEESVKVVNFGMGAIDSNHVKKRVLSLPEINITPDLVVIYSGHNDYTNYYHMSGFNRHFEDFLGFSSFLTFTRLHHPVPGRDFRGPFFNLLQHFGLIDFDGNEFDIVNDMILDNFISNNEEIQSFLREKNIPMLYITTIGNLEARPYGDIDITEEYYKKGIHANDYEERIHYLRKAMDSELFTFDIRAHSDLNDYIRSLSDHSDIYVLDLEKRLMNEEFAFGHSEFSDYLHFRHSTDRKIAEILHDTIIRDEILDIE